MTDTTTNWTRYQNRVRTVIKYIHDNPHENLTSEVLAEVAHLSPYHWHRIYKAITGESAVATVKRCRMHIASATLLRTDTPLAEIGASVGYDDTHSFNRTFKQFYGVAPGQFRAAQVELDATTSPPKEPSSKIQSVQLLEWPATCLTGLWHYGDFMKIGATFEQVIAQCSISGVMPEQPQTIGLYLADPDCTVESELKSFAGIVVTDSVEIPDQLQSYEYPGGRFAVLTHKGPYALLSARYNWLYSKWLPASDEAVRDQPCCEVYLNSPVDTAQQELLTEICLPLE